MSDPIQKPVVVRNSLTVIGPIGAATLVTTGLATLASANIQGTAVVGTSLIVSGPVTGTSFSGIGTSLTALNASNLDSGTIPVARLGTTGTPGISTFLRGDNSWGSAVTAVTVVAANGISGSVATQGTTPAITLTLGAITPTSVVASGNVSAASFIGSGASLTSLNAANISSGLIAQARLGTGSANSSSYLRGDGVWAFLPAFGTVTTVSVATANGISGTVATPTTTPVITLTLGAITPTSVTASGSVAGATVSSSGLATLNSVSVTNNATVGGTLGVTGQVTAPAFSGALVGTGPYTPVLTTGVFAGVNSSQPSIPQFGLIATVAPANAKASTFYVASNGTLNWALLQDDLTTNNSFMTVARSGITATNITFAGTAITLSGAVTGTSFSGVGTNLTALNASNLSTGTVASARLGTGTANTTTYLRGDGAWVTPPNSGGTVTLVTVAVSSGIVADVSAPSTTPMISLSLGNITPTSVVATGAITGATLSGAGSAITALNASNLATGTVPTARLASGTANSQTFLRGDGFWAIPQASGDVSVTAVTSSGLGTFGSLTVNGASTLNTLSVNSSATLASLTVNSNASFSAGFTANGAASIGGSLSVGGSLTAGDVTGNVFIPTSNTAPTYGVYEGTTVGGVAIATGGLERLSVSPSGVITQSGPVVSVITTLTSSTVDCSKGNYFKRTYTGAQTWTFTNVPAGVFYSFILRLIRGASGTQTWPSSVKWSGGAAPTLTTTNGGSDIMEFMTDDGGVSWRAFRRTTTTT